jgi:hypothetical protein
VELKINIDYQQLMELIKQLPAAKIIELKAELSDNFIGKKSASDISDFQQFLLDWPVMRDKQFHQFTENRERFK